MNSAWPLFHSCEHLASLALSSLDGGGQIAPVVGDSSHMKERRPLRTVSK